MCFDLGLGLVHCLSFEFLVCCYWWVFVGGVVCLFGLDLGLRLVGWV